MLSTRSSETLESKPLLSVRHPYLMGPVDYPSICGIHMDLGLLDTIWLCPIYRDPYFHKKSGRVSFVWVALPNIQPL